MFGFVSDGFGCYITRMVKASSREPEPPERYFDHLARRLNRHRLWNCLLAVLPPLLLLAYAVGVLFLLNWVGFGVLLFCTAAIVGVGLAVVLHFKTTWPTKEKLARLIDERVDGKEHFLTLATIDLSQAGPSVLAELRSHASRLLRRVNFKQVFPYRMKRGSVFSLVVSILSILLIHFFLTNPVSSVPDAVMLKKVPELAQRFSRESGLQALAANGQHAAGDLLQKIQSTSMVKQLMQQLGSGSQDGQQQGRGQNSGSTGQAEGGKGNRQPSNAAGTEQVAGQGQGQGEAGRTPGEDQGDLANASNDELGDGKPSQRGSQKGDPSPKPGGAGERDDPGRNGPNDGSPKDQAKRKKGRPGAGNPGQQIPQGKEPDRFHPSGEGEEGIEGGRFITVALPKALSSGGGEAIASGQQGGRSNSPIPVSNVPLPPRNGPEMDGEKQHMPLEYEGLIQ
jgi:hypothetical protein